MPYFKYLDWVNEFLPNVDSELQATVFLAYRQMLAGTALSNISAVNVKFNSFTYG